MAFVSGQNLANPSQRQKFLEAQRTQKVTGGLNRPAIGKEQYIRVVDVTGKVIEIPQKKIILTPSKSSQTEALTQEQIDLFNQDILKKQLE
jgi:hypothetical protein